VYKSGALRQAGANWNWVAKRSEAPIKASLSGILGVRRERERDVISHSEAASVDDLL